MNLFSLGLVLCAAAAAPQGPLDGMAQGALSAAVGPNVRVQVDRVKAHLPRGCAAARMTVSGPVVPGSPARLTVEGFTARGSDCSGTAVATFALLAPRWVLTRGLAAGEPLGDAVEERWVHLTAGAAAPDSGLLPERARTWVALRALLAGAVLTPSVVGPRMPAVGAVLPLRVQRGAVLLRLQGVRVACAGTPHAGRACARLPTGRVVSGTWSESEETLDVDGPAGPLAAAQTHSQRPGG